MRDLPALDGDVVELDGAGRCAIPGLVDCHTHAAFGGDRVEEFSLRAAGASYEELHARGGGILSTVRATRAAGEDGLRQAVERHRGWMLRHGTTTFEAKSGYGLDRDTELASLRAIRAAGGIPTWLGAHAVPPEFAGADAYLDFALAEVLPEAATARRGRRRLPRARRLRRRAGAPLPRGVPRRRASRCACTATSSREQGAIPLAIELGARSVDHLEATGDGRRSRARRERRRRRPAARERALPRPADAAGARPRRRGSGGRARDRLQPGQRLLREPAALLLARRDAAEALAGGGARGLHRQRGARARPRRPARPARARLPRRPRPARRARLALPRVPPRRRARRAGRARGASYASPAMPSRKQKRREAKSKRHEYEFVYVDSEGNELEEPPEELVTPSRAKASSNGSKAAPSKQPAQQTARPPRAAAAVLAARGEARRSSSGRSCSRSSLSPNKKGGLHRRAPAGAHLHRALRPVHVHGRPLRLPPLPGAQGERRFRVAAAGEEALNAALDSRG